MEYQKMMNVLDNKLNGPSKFRTKNLVEISDGLHAVYSTVSQFNLKTSLLKSSLCDYSDAYMLVSSRLAIKEGPENATNADKSTDERKNEEMILQNCAQFIECTSENRSCKRSRYCNPNV